jgi:peptidoglycan/xylan/chitin deacetylase (PgdA/CDA1 family)
MWRAVGLIVLSCAAFAVTAHAAECPGKPNALGTSRMLTIDPREFPRIGTIQYAQSLPLQDKEVVLTFDDGPMPPYTTRVLEVLAEHCVKANFFVVGRMARNHPDLLRQIRAAGHVIGTHSQTHPPAFDRMALSAVQSEVEQGIASAADVLGDRNAVAPFFRIPGLLRSQNVEGFLQARGLATWSADAVSDDWRHITAAEVVRRSIKRLDEKGKGILLLHDIQPATALALPELLRQLKANGYRIVLVVPKPSIPVLVAKAEAPAKPSELAARAPTAETLAATLPPPLWIATPEPAIPREPALPYAQTLKPAQGAATPSKLAAVEPGGPPIVIVPMPQAGGAGASPIVRTSQTPDGRFQDNR